MNHKQNFNNIIITSIYEINQKIRHKMIKTPSHDLNKSLQVNVNNMMSSKRLAVFISNIVPVTHQKDGICIKIQDKAITSKYNLTKFDINIQIITHGSLRNHGYKFQDPVP